MTINRPNDKALLAVLERAWSVGFLGPGPVHQHLRHALNYSKYLPAGPHRLIDLGSGAGLPGLPLLLDRPEIQGVLLDSAQKRASFLVWALASLGMADRCEVVVDRAEVRAHDVGYRASFDVVVCRGFGPPALTVECGAGYLRQGGRLLISEPPEARVWPVEGLDRLGLSMVPSAGEIAVFQLDREIPAEIPRTFKQMRDSPLFTVRRA